MTYAFWSLGNIYNKKTLLHTNINKINLIHTTDMQYVELSRGEGDSWTFDDIDLEDMTAGW